MRVIPLLMAVMIALLASSNARRMRGLVSTRSAASPRNWSVATVSSARSTSHGVRDADTAGMQRRIAALGRLSSLLPIKTEIILTSLLLTTMTAFTQPQILRDSITINGKSIDIQTFSLECDMPIMPSEAKPYWSFENRIYTIHLSDTGRLSADEIKQLRPNQLGFFAWSTNEWNNFARIGENILWLFEANDFGYGGQFITSSGNTVLYLKNFRLGIHRSTLTVEPDGIFSCVTGSTITPCGKIDKKSYDFPRKKGICQVVEYKKPPQRIGF